MVIGKYFNDDGELEIIVELERDELFDCVKPSVRRIKILIDGDVN
jgi:hypothetical protein